MAELIIMRELRNHMGGGGSLLHLLDICTRLQKRVRPPRPPVAGGAGGGEGEKVGTEEDKGEVGGYTGANPSGRGGRVRNNGTTHPDNHSLQFQILQLKQTISSGCTLAKLRSACDQIKEWVQRTGLRVGSLICVTRFYTMGGFSESKEIDNLADAYGTVTSLEHNIIHFSDPRFPDTLNTHDTSVRGVREVKILRFFPSFFEPSEDMFKNKWPKLYNTMNPKLCMTYTPDVSKENTWSGAKTSHELTYQIKCTPSPPTNPASDLSTDLCLMYDEKTKSAYVVVNELNKLPGCMMSGTIVLNSICTWANMVNEKTGYRFLQFVHLIDASEILDSPSCAYDRHPAAISLRDLSLWSTGQSWYNRQGFCTLTHELDLPHNEAVVAMPMSALVDAMPVASGKYLPFVRKIKILTEFIPGLKNEDLTIGKFFSTIRTQLRVPLEITDDENENVTDLGAGGNPETGPLLTLMENSDPRACFIKKNIRGVLGDLTDISYGAFSKPKNPLPLDVSIKYDWRRLFYWLPWISKGYGS
jgi:hypothetical protein